MQERNNHSGYSIPLRHGWGLYYDPLYGYMHIPPVIRYAMNLPCMQRLRYIKQLSTAYLVFSGATHTRFEHSVGVYHLATEVHQVLFRKKMDHEEWPDLNQATELALQLAALFHDVGHGPWGHVFEIFCKRNCDFSEWKHEKQTATLISKGVGAYNHIPLLLNDLHRKLQKIPNAELLLPKNVAAIATGSPPPSDKKYLFLSQIVASEFDVDRMDYLRRDALHTAVGTGSVDMWEILYSYTIAEDLIEKGMPSGTWGAKISSNAAEAVEALLTGRDLAYRKVYYHKTHRSAEEMMIRAMYEISDKYAIEELSSMTDEDLLRAFEGEKGNLFTKDVAKRIRRRRLYEPLPFEVQVFNDLDTQAQENISEYSTPKSIEEYKNILKSMDDLATALNFPKEWRVIFDIEEVPVSKGDAYKRPYFYNENTKELKSLLELLPHLALTHGEILYPGMRPIDLGRRYVREISKLLIIMPFQFIEKFITKCKDEGIKKGIILTFAEIEKIANEVYQRNLQVIIEQYIDFLGIRDQTKKDQLLKKFRENMVHYITEWALESYPKRSQPTQ